MQADHEKKALFSQSRKIFVYRLLQGYHINKQPAAFAGIFHPFTDKAASGLMGNSEFQHRIVALIALQQGSGRSAARLEAGNAFPVACPFRR